MIASGSGVFANIGGYRITFASSGASYAITSLSSTVGPSAGTYTYSKTGANTGSLTVTDTAVGAAVAQTLVFSSASSGTYSISGSAGSQTGTLTFEGAGPSLVGLINMSVRAQVPTGSQTIPGLVIDSQTRVLVRAAGPGLAGFGVSGTLPNPRLTVFQGSNPIAGNDDWSSTPTNQAAVQTASLATGAFAYVIGSLDAAMVMDLNAGAYTFVVSGASGTSGEVLVEVYRVPQ